MDERRDRETAELLEELETTLEALRGELAGRERRRPTPTDLLRFTEEYTVPTVVATLEATIASLELLRAFLRLLDPDRSVADGPSGGGTGLGRAGESAVTGAERAVSEVRAALAEGNLPEEPEARRLVTEARELSEAVEERLRESRGVPDAGDTPGADADRGVAIDVTAEREDPPADGSGVDVDAELDSIRSEVRDGGDDQDERDDTR